MGTKNWQGTILLSGTMGFQMGMFFIWFSSSLNCKSSMLGLHMEKSLLSMLRGPRMWGMLSSRLLRRGKVWSMLKIKKLCVMASGLMENGFVVVVFEITNKVENKDEHVEK